MFVRVLKQWRGLHPGIFADVRGAALKDGIAEAALDANAKAADVPDAETHPDVIGEDDKPAKAKK